MGLRLKLSDGAYYAEDTNDTSLRFTDVLFGFALREVVLRLVKWEQLNVASRIHLLLTTLVILGSYVGFRNSQKRGRFKLRFLNLATMRFVLDQAMVFLYFLLALYISLDKDPATGQLSPSPAAALSRFDARVIVAIFALYFVWDLISHWMARCGRYFISKGDPNAEPTTSDLRLQAPMYRTVVTGAALAIACALMLVSEYAEPKGSAATWLIAAMAGLAVTYRLTKDMLVEAA
jgi:hypothetical protein